MDRNVTRQLRRILGEKTPEAWLVAADYAEEHGEAQEAARLRFAGTALSQVVERIRAVRCPADDNPPVLGFISDGKHYRISITCTNARKAIIAVTFFLSPLDLPRVWGAGSRGLDRARVDEPRYVWGRAREVLGWAGIDTKLPAWK